MARPRRPFGGQEVIQAAAEPWLGLQLGVRQRSRWDSSAHWTYRTPNGVFDPLTYLFVLDSLANMDPQIELRAGVLAEWLNQARHQVLWDPITVGKVLSDICDQFEDALWSAGGTIEASFSSFITPMRSHGCFGRSARP
jgi:hypothetical protein